jgi:hypothetical protein
MRIVGSAIFAAFSVGGGNGTDLGNGAAVSASVLSQPNPPFCAGHATCYNFFLLRYRPGTDLRAAAARLEAAVIRAHCPKGLCLVTTDQPSGISVARAASGGHQLSRAHIRNPQASVRCPV